MHDVRRRSGYSFYAHADLLGARQGRLPGIILYLTLSTPGVWRAHVTVVIGLSSRYSAAIGWPLPTSLLYLDVFWAAELAVAVPPGRHPLPSCSASRPSSLSRKQRTRRDHSAGQTELARRRMTAEHDRKRIKSFCGAKPTQKVQRIKSFCGAKPTQKVQRIKSFCGAKPTQKVRWTNAEVEVWAGLYGDFTADAWRLD